MNKRIIRLHVEFRQAKFIFTDIPLPVFYFEKKEEENPKRDDEEYER